MANAVAPCAQDRDCGAVAILGRWRSPAGQRRRAAVRAGGDAARGHARDGRRDRAAGDPDPGDRPAALRDRRRGQRRTRTSCAATSAGSASAAPDHADARPRPRRRLVPGGDPRHGRRLRLRVLGRPAADHVRLGAATRCSPTGSAATRRGRCSTGSSAGSASAARAHGRGRRRDAAARDAAGAR